MLLGSLKWIVLPLAAVCAFAQTKHTRIDVQKYTIDADVNPRTQAITATAKIEFTPAEAGNDISFELNNALTVSKAVDGRGQTLTTTRNAQDFTVTAVSSAPLEKGQPGQITLSYEGKLSGSEESPISGIKFAALHPDFGYLLYPARWFPVNGYTTNRFAADLRITAPAGYRVVGSGDLKTDHASGGGTIYSFHSEKAGFPGSIAILQAEPAKVTSQGIASDVFFRG